MKPNWFVRTLVGIVCLLLAAMVGFSFVLGNPPFSISTGAITVILIVTVLVLAESFNSLSIGQILSLSKEVHKKEEQNSELKTENHRLRDQIIQITSVFNQQSQVNATINGMTPDTLRALIGVTGATERDKDREEVSTQAEAATPDAEEGSHRVPYYQVARRMEEKALEDYSSKHQLPIGTIARDVQFTPLFQGLDPISERNVIFDGYLKSPVAEQFFEVLIRRHLTPFRWDRIYVMLSKILNYRRAKNVAAELVLIIINIPESHRPPVGSRDPLARFVEIFQPAIGSGLLKVETIDYTDEDMQKVERELLAIQGPANTAAQPDSKAAG